MKENSQIKSKKRVEEHGEVFTNEREVNAMLDLVKSETERIESTFLEPACGDGNFLAEIITRKLAVISKSRKPNYKKDQPAYEKAMLVAVGSIYGIDIMPDNVKECVGRLYHIISKEYEKRFKNTYSEDVEHCVRFILSRNIVCGNALDMKDYKGEPIKFSEWKNPFNGWIHRSEYAFEDLLEKGDEALPLSDTEVPYYIPREIKDYGNIDYRKVYEYEEQE
jgi:hypothetical protein